MKCCIVRLQSPSALTGVRREPQTVSIQLSFIKRKKDSNDISGERGVGELSEDISRCGPGHLRWLVSFSAAGVWTPKFLMQEFAVEYISLP